MVSFLAHNPGMCPDWNQIGNPLIHRPMLNPLSHTSQGSLRICKGFLKLGTSHFRCEYFLPICHVSFILFGGIIFHRYFKFLCNYILTFYFMAFEYHVLLPRSQKSIFPNVFIPLVFKFSDHFFPAS